MTTNDTQAVNSRRQAHGIQIILLFMASEKSFLMEESLCYSSAWFKHHAIDSEQYRALCRSWILGEFFVFLISKL